MILLSSDRHGRDPLISGPTLPLYRLGISVEISGHAALTREHEGSGTSDLALLLPDQGSPNRHP